MKISLLYVSLISGISVSQMLYLRKSGEITQEQMNKWAEEAEKVFEPCKTCYYTASEGCIAGCNYPLFHPDPSTIPCNHYLNKKRDYTTVRGCGNCRFYESEELFSGKCSITGEEKTIYHPACRTHFKATKEAENNGRTADVCEINSIK